MEKNVVPQEAYGDPTHDNIDRYRSITRIEEATLNKYKVEQLEKSVFDLHNKFDELDEKLFGKEGMHVNLASQISTLQTDMKWVKWIAMGLGGATGFVAGFIGWFSNIPKPPGI